MRRSALALLACLVLAGNQPLVAQSAVDVVAQHNSAYQRGDLDAFIATFAEDAVVVAEGFEVHGREAIAASYAPNFARGAPLVRVNRQGRVAGGGIIQVESYILADGSEECCTTSTIYVRDGQIARLVVDTTELGG